MAEFDHINDHTARARAVASAEEKAAEADLLKWTAERKAKAAARFQALCRKMNVDFIRRAILTAIMVLVAFLTWFFGFAHIGLALAVGAGALVMFAFWAGVWWEFRASVKRGVRK